MTTAGAELMDRLGIALLHSLWQGSLVGLALLAVLLLLLRRSSAQARYAASCAALVMMLVLPAGTFLVARLPRPAIDRAVAPPPSRLVTSAAAALEAAASLLPAEFPDAVSGEDQASSAPRVTYP
jgi:bla regulator protein BlaR1